MKRTFEAVPVTELPPDDENYIWIDEYGFPYLGFIFQGKLFIKMGIDARENVEALPI